jgi:glycerate 2-kinase
VHILAAPDKFRGTATAAQVAEAIAEACTETNSSCTCLPLADGGEGTLAAMGGPNMRSAVTGPRGETVAADWRLDGDLAIIEMAEASGLMLAGGMTQNDPIGATSRGTGELIRLAFELGAARVIVGVGGSACTDGGIGAVEALGDLPALDGSEGFEVTVAKDVDTLFCQAARVFGPQKGATPRQVEKLTGRLESVAELYRTRYHVDVRDIAGAGAGGGLAGGLAMLGARLESGFDLVARELDLAAYLASADLVITGEGKLDRSSFRGKVVGGVMRLADNLNVESFVVVGQAQDVDVSGRIFDLTREFGLDRALSETTSLIKAVTFQFLVGLDVASS